MRKSLAVLAALAFSACVGNGVEFGGVDKPQASPSNAVACNSDSLNLVSKVLPRYPVDAVMFYLAAQKHDTEDVMEFRYDVRETGEVVNIRFVGPPEFTRHATRQKMIRAAADALAQWKYEWVGAPAYATGCKFTIEYEMMSERSPA